MCLLNFFVFSFHSLPYIISWIPKWQHRGRQRGWRTFLMEGFYILTILPSLFLNLVQWGGKSRRQMEEKNINKLHRNWWWCSSICPSGWRHLIAEHIHNRAANKNIEASLKSFNVTVNRLKNPAVDWNARQWTSLFCLCSCLICFILIFVRAAFKDTNTAPLNGVLKRDKYLFLL